MTKARSHIDDLRDAGRLAVEATAAVTDLVEAMHLAVGGRIAGFFAAPVYATIRGTAKVVGFGIDRALAALSPAISSSAPGPEREALLAALNGVLGDYLAETKNPLAIEMSLRGERGPRRLVLIHGSSMNDLQWSRKGHDHGESLARAFGYAPLYLRYNSGLHVSTNGRALSALLEQHADAEEIVLLGHSMGGLVARSACHFAELSGCAWRRKLRALITLGTPHHGASLERFGNVAQLLLGVSRYSAPFVQLAKIRSAGVTDLRFGNLLDEDWQGLDRFAHGPDRRTHLPLPEGVRCFAVAGAVNGKGDGLVSVESALGIHRDPARTLGFEEANRFVASDAGHLDLLDNIPVYDQLSSWLAK